MTARALLIGVERYPHDEELGGELANTIAHVECFEDWLLTTGRVEARHIVKCVGVPSRGPTAEEIIAAIWQLWHDGSERTRELFVYYSGHGLCFQQRESEPYVDLLVGSDFRSRRQSGRACLSLQEFQTLLRYGLGPGRHYYFVEACRFDGELIEVSSTGLRLGRTELGAAEGVYTIFATDRGSFTPVDEAFSLALLSGLGGAGTAKQLDCAHNYVVTLNSLFEYMQAQVRDAGHTRPLEQSTDGRPSDPLLVRLQDVADVTCELVLRGVSKSRSVTLTISLGAQVIRREAIDINPDDPDGNVYRFSVPPWTYLLQLHADGHAIASAKLAAPIQLFEDMRLEIDLEPPDHTSNEGFGHTLSIVGAEEVLIRGTTRDVLTVASVPLAGGEVSVPAGRYFIDVLEHDRVVATASVEVGDSPAFSQVDLARVGSSAAHLEILRATGNSVDAPTIELSEQLGPMYSRDLNLWLALVAAKRVLEPGGAHDIDSLALAPAKRSTAVYVLSEESSFGVFEIDDGLVTNEQAPLKPTRAMPSVRESLVRVDLTSARSALAFFGLPAQLAVPITLVPGCVTILTLVRGGERGVSLRQQLLPLDPSGVPGWAIDLCPDPLRVVRLAIEMQGRYLAWDDIEPNEAERTDYFCQAWGVLSRGEWRDPVLDAMLAQSRSDSSVWAERWPRFSLPLLQADVIARSDSSLQPPFARLLEGWRQDYASRWARWFAPFPKTGGT